MFDDDNLVSCAGLVPVMTVAERTGLSELLAHNVHIAAPPIKSGADCIDDVDIVRSGGMKILFGGVYAPSTIGTLLREFTFGHNRQLESALASDLPRLCAQVEFLPGADVRAFLDIDSQLRPVYVTPNKAPPTDTRRSRASRSFARTSRRWRPRSAPTSRCR